MKKFILLAAIMFPIWIHSSIPIYTISLQVKDFVYNPKLMILDVPEYNSSSVRTAGIPGGSNDVLFGWSRTKQPIKGFALDERGNNVLK